MSEFLSRYRGESFRKPIAFVNPNSRSRGLVHSGPPYGIMSLMGLCRDLGIPCGLVEADALNLSEEEVAEAVLRGGYAYMGVPLVSLNAKKVFSVLERLKERTGLPLIVGGPLPTVDTQWLMESCPAVDFAVLGDGEPVLPPLLLALDGRGRIEDIPGLAYRSGGGIVIQPQAKGFIPCAELPRPDFETVDFSLYPGAMPVGAWPCAHVMAIRGCPYQCTFCCNIWRRKPDAFAIPVLLDWISHLSSRGVKEIFFIDDTLNLNHDWFEELCIGILARGLDRDLRFKGKFRADLANREQLAMARRAGFWVLFFGAEAATPEMLEYYRKNERLEDIAAAIEATRSVPGLKSFAGFIAGAPPDTEETLAAIGRFIRETDPTYGLVQILHPFIGATIADDITSRGILTQQEIREYDHTRHSIRTETLSTADLVRIVDEISQEVFDYKLSPERRQRRRRELSAVLGDTAAVEAHIRHEEVEARVVREQGVPRHQFFDRNSADLTSVADHVNPGQPDNRLDIRHWHDSERTFRWSLPRFELPFFLPRPCRKLRLEWAPMRPGVTVCLVLDNEQGRQSLELAVTGVDWHEDVLELPEPVRGGVWLTCEISSAFFAPNDIRELGMAVRRIAFTES